ncbi:MAG TPA: hypothetical protein PK285_11730 [Bacteroidales bacterium]|jgi:hypothetical protein|nr:hypothetical protein [Bacteroidales bacterium]
MKYILVIMASVVLLVSFTSCQKKTIPEGEYSFTFVNTTGLQMTPITIYYEIVESTDEYVIIGNSYQDTLYKDGPNITGTITYYGSIPNQGRNTIFNPFQITGIYDRSKGIYFIKGTFVSKIIIPNPEEERTDTIDTSGTFEMKSVF